MQEFLVLNLVKSDRFNNIFKEVSTELKLKEVEVCDELQSTGIIIAEISSIDSLQGYKSKIPIIGVSYSANDINFFYEKDIFLTIPHNITAEKLKRLIKQQIEAQRCDIITASIQKNKSYAFEDISYYLDTAFLNSTLGVAFLKKDLNILIFNPRFSDFFHNIYAKQPEIGKEIHYQLGAKTVSFWKEIIKQCSSFTGECLNLQGKWDDERKHYQMQITPIMKQENLIGYAIIIKDISEYTNANADLKRYYNYLMEQNLRLENAYKELDLNNKKLKVAYEKVNALSNHDYLTQAPNRKYFLEKIEYEQLRFKRTKNPFILVYADIDDFKKVNDDYGHETGDYVLISLTNLIKTTIRNIDFFCRWGGEEFLIFLAETNLKVGKTIVERILSEIREHEFNYNGKTLKVTMTFGLAIYEKDQHINEIIDTADKMLYWGKKHNKNQVVESIPDDKL